MLTEEQKKKASSYRNSQNQTGLTDDQKKKADSYRTSLQSPEDWQQRTSSLASAVLTLDHAVAGNQWRSGTQLSRVKSQIDSLERAKNLFFSLYGGNAGADQRVAELDEKLAGYRDWLAQKEKEYAAELDGSAARERQAAAIADYTGGETKNPYAIGTSVAAMMHQQALPDSEDELQDLLADEQEAQRKAGSKSHRVATALYNWLSGDSIAETREADQVTQNAHENRVRRVSDALAAAKLQRYADYRNEKDFTENSQYRSTAEDGEFVTTADGKTYLVQDGQYHRYSGTGFGDIEYDFINKNERATDLVTNGGWASDYEKTAEFMTDDEIAMFNYLYARQGAESAYAYMDSLQTTLNARYREKAEEAAREFAQESPALASVYSVASAPVKGLAYIGQTIDYLDDGVIDQNAPYNRVSYGTNAMISQVAEDISGSMGDIALAIGDFVTSGATRLLPEQWREKVRQTLNGSKFWGSAGSFLYQTGMSMGEFLLTSAVTMGNEPLALGILGTGAAADAVIAAKDRGLNDGQAFTLGTIAGAAEIITEKISIETLLNPDLLADGTLKYILENALAEGGEEVGSDVINLIADLIISGDKSEWAVSMQEYMAAGKTEAAAFGLTLANQGEEMILDFLGGALSGGVMGSGMAVANNIYTGRLVDDLNLGSMTDEDIRAMVETGLESGEDTSSYKLAKKIQEKLDSGENPTATELARLFQANAQAIEQEQQESEPEQKQSKARALFDRAVEQAKERNMFHRAAQTVTGATDTKKTSSTSQTTSKSSGQSTTETAKPEAASAPTVSSESEYVRTAMASGAVSREDAAKIVQMPGYAAAFEKETGIKLTGTEEQKINAVIQGGAAWAENQRLRGIAQASQNAVPGESTATKAQRTTAWDSFYTYGKVAAEATKPIDFEQARSSLVAFAQLLGDKTAREAFEKGRTDAKSAQKARQTQTAKKKSSGKFTDKRTQTPKGGEYKALTDTLRAFSKKTGIDVELVDSLSSGSTKANGRLLVDTMTIQLSADSNNILSALGHETAEYLKAYSPEAYTQVRDQILNWWMSHESASSIDEVVERYREAYIRAGQKSKSYSSALDEVLNDALGAMLTTDEGLESFVKWVNTASNLTQTQRKNLFKQIGDIIRKMIDGLKELLKNSRLTSDQKRFLEMEAQEQQKILDRFLDAVERTQVEVSEGEASGKAEYSYAGEKSRTADTEALRRAQEMEKQGDDAETIRQETGWFRGVDGKWRYEIDDSKMRYHKGGDALFAEDHPDYARYQELVDRMIYGTLTAGEEQEMRALHEVWGNEHGRLSRRVADGNATLENILRHDALFDAYPQLRKTRVVFGDVKSGANGYYIGHSNTITLSKNLRGAPESTLLHEIQHVIQGTEGFSPGASPGYWRMETESAENWVELAILDSRLKELTERVDKLGEETGYNAFSEELFERLMNDEITEEESDRLEAQWLSQNAPEIAKLNEQIYEMRRKRAEVSRRSPDPYELYRNTAGEIEARDTAQRRGMSSDERKKTPPNLGDENTVFAERDTVTENEKTDRMEYSLAGYDQHQIDNWAGSKNIVVYQGRQQLHQFLTDAVNGQNLSKKIYFGAIPSDLAQRILKDTGINVDGYNCTLRASEVRKILKDHGNTATENKRGQRAITISDFERIPDVIQRPDRIELSQNLFEGKPVILFSKVIDGKTTVVAYVSEKHKDLTVQTMYSGKNKNGSLATTPGGANSLPQTSKTLSGTASNGNVTQSSERVKSEYSIEVPTEELNPVEIVPVNEVTDRRKYRYLTEQFAENGWDGRPVVVIDTGNGYTALTGSHRVAAARAAMIDVPAVVLEYSDELSDLVNAIDDEDRTREAKLLYEAGIIHKDVYDLIAREDELNVSNYGVAYGDQAKWSIEVPESEVSQEQRDEWESVFNASGASREAYDEMQGEVEKAEQAAAEAVRAARKSGVLGRKVSMEDPQKTVAKLQEENRKLRERLDYWREQIRKTKKGEFRVDKFFVKRVAEKLIENYGLRTWTDAQDLAGELTDLYTRIAKGDPYESYAGDAEQLARKIAQHATDDYMYREYEEFRNTLRETTLSLSKSEAGQIADFNDLRKRYFGRVKIRTGETNVDQIFQNLAVEMPTGLLSEEAYNNPVDQFLRLLEVVDTLYEPGGKLYNRESMDTAVEIIRDEILHGFVTTEAGPTFADRQAEARKTAVQKAEDQVNRKRDKELGDTVAALSKQAQQFADEAAERGRLEGMLAGQMMQGRQMAAAVRQANARSATLEERLDSASRTIRELRKQLDEEKRGAWEDARESVRLSHALERSEAAVKKARDRLKEYRENRNERDAVARERLQVEKLAKSLAKMLTTNTSKSYVPEDLKTAVGDLLQSIDFSSKSLREKGQQTRRDRDYAAMMTKVRQALEAHTRFDDGGDMFVDLPSEFLGLLQEHIDNVVESAGRASAIGTNIVFEMSSGQLSDLRHILTVVHSALKNINSFYVAARGQTVRQAADSTIRYAREHGDAKGNPDSWIRRQLEWDNTVPVYAFLRFGDGGKQVFSGMQDGWDKFAFNLKAVFDFKAATFTDKEAQEWAEQVHEVTLGEETVKLSSAQIMSLVSLAKREHGQQHLLQGGIRIDDIARKVKGKDRTIRQSQNYNLTMEDISTMEGMLTARQRDVAAKMQKFMQEQGSAWGNEVTMKRFGYRGFTEENYFPIMSDPNNMAAMDPNAKANDMMRLINMSATKPVNEKANNAVVISNIFDVFANHMADMAKYNALALPILDMMKWYNYVEKVDGADGQFTTRSVQQSLEAAYGKAAGNYIRTFIKDLNGVKEFGRGEDWSAKLMSNYKVAAVGNNLRVAALQPTAYVRAWAVLDLPSMGRALSMNPKKGASEMERYSGMGLWKSMGFYDTNVNRGLRDQLSGRGTKVDNLRDKSMAAAELMDKLTWGVIWNACKLEIMDSSKLTGEALMEATAKKFREVVYKTQVVDSTMTRSQNMRSKNFAVKLSTAFMSEPTLSYNLVMEGVRGYQEAKRTGSGMDKAKKLMVRSFLAYGASALVSAIVESFVDALRDDDDYETFPQKFNQAFWGENGKFWEGNLVQDLMIHNKLPLVKDIIAIFGGDTVDRMDMASFTDLKSAYDAWAETVKLATGKLESPTKATYYGNMTLYGKIYKSLKAVSELMGLPVSSATRDVVSIWNKTVGRWYKDLKIKTYDPGDEQSILNALKDGHITADAAQALLVEKVEGISADDAYWAAKKAATGYSKTGELSEALESGDTEHIQACIDEMLDHGYEQKDISGAVSPVIKKLYTEDEDGNLGAGRISREQAEKLLASWITKDESEIFWTLRKWDQSVEAGETVGQYDDLYDAIASGDGVQNAVQFYMDNGVEKKTMSGNVTRAFEEEYIDLYYSDPMAADALKQRLIAAYKAMGYTTDEAREKISGWLEGDDEE